MTTVTARTWMAMGALLLVALGLAYALTRITIDSDYSAFLPAGASDTQRAFMRELGLPLVQVGSAWREALRIIL